MKEVKHTIIDPLGLHARPASQLVKLANKFSSDINICANEITVSAKGIFAVMKLAAKQNTELFVTICGHDELQAATEIEDFFSQGV